VSPEQRVDRVFARQHGIATLADALRAGMTPSQIRHRVRSQRWEQVGRGVVRLSGSRVTPHQRIMAAVLAGPPGTVASHLTAAWLFGGVQHLSSVHVTVPRAASARRVGAVVHRADLSSGDRTSMANVPCTSGARTALDCAQVLSSTALSAVVDALIFDGFTSADRIHRALALDKAPGRPGEGRLKEVLRLWSDPIAPGSPAEIRLLRRLAQWDLPMPVTQHPVRDVTGKLLGKVDVAWPAVRVGLEYDGVKWHGPSRIERDEDRQAALEAAGWRLERVDRTDAAAGLDRLRRRLVPLLLPARSA